MRNVLIVIALLFAANSVFCQTTRVPAIQLHACEVAGINEKVKCGTLEVFEDRIKRQGRKIQLKIVVLPATGPNPKSDPLFYIPGGPGSSATEDAAGFAKGLEMIREHRDLVFVDQRGTGGSHPLNCTLHDPNDPQSALGYFFPLEEIKKCRQELEKKADLTLYTTPIAMDDLDDVRSALGYSQINIIGVSYGTRATLTYLKRHPKSVRTIILHGVVPSGDYMPFDFARRAERAYQGVIDECLADKACSTAFPNLRAEAKAVLERLIQGPVETEISIPAAQSDTNRRQVKVKLSRDLAAEALRYMLYSANGATRLPLVIHQAANGNYAPLAQNAYRFRRNLVATGSNGMYLSVTCAEDLPWFKRSEAEDLAANTLLGTYRIRQQLEACQLWPRAQVDPDYASKSSTPVLMLTGQWDPVTPPSNAVNASGFLTNSLNVVVPQGGHGFFGLDGTECIDSLIARFLELGTVNNLDTSCVSKIRRHPFVLK